MVSIGYDFGDWLLKKRILKYVKFYSPQQAKLEVILDDFMAWHKKSELDQYILDVKGVKARFVGAKDTPLTKSEIAGYLKQFRSRYFQSFNYLSEKMIPLFILLNSDQIERTKVLLGRKLDEKKDRSKILKSELIKQLERKWLENLEEWFGPLSPKQKELIAKSAPSSFIDPLIVWSRHGKRTNNFINIFDEKDSTKRSIALSKFFKDWQEEDFYSSWRDDVSTILVGFFATLNTTQRSFAIKKLDNTLEIIKNLKD